MSASSDSNNWFVCPGSQPEAELRLFLFPYAGGGPAAFSKWVSGFPNHIEAWIAHYPGRGSRHQDAPMKQITTLAERFSQAVRPLLDRPFAFFGHSLGGLIAFELTRQMRQQDLPQPQALFISACGAPHLPDSHPPIHGYPDFEFMKSLQELNGIPSELLRQPDVMQLLLPVLRADFEAVESYEYSRDESPLHVPILAFAGLNDPRVSRERIEGWAIHTDAGFRSCYFPGDHFFINTCREVVITCISEGLTSYAKK